MNKRITFLRKRNRVSFTNKIFNNAKFDDFCIDICNTLFAEKGIEFPNKDYDILISYPHTIEPNN